MLHYYPRHVSSINMPIFRRKNPIHTASGIVALCKRLHSTLFESRLCRVTLTSWNPLGHSRPVTGLLYLYTRELHHNIEPTRDDVTETKAAKMRRRTLLSE